MPKPLIQSTGRRKEAVARVRIRPGAGQLTINGRVFESSGGHETTLWSIMTPMASLGLILVPPGYTDAAMFAGGSPYGATATTGASSPTEADLAAARHQGRRVATVTGWIAHARSHHH